MNFRSRKRIIDAVLLGLVVSMGTGWVHAQSTGIEPAKRMAEEVFKNIEVMKGVPAEQMNPTMDIFRAALGVRGCTYCHDNDGDQFDLDVKPAKQITRKMMQMTLDLNKNSFDGRAKVTCYSCHRGSTKPELMPPVAGQESVSVSSEVPSKPEDAALPTVDTLVDKYVISLGGLAAIRKVSTRVTTGTVTDAAGHKSPMEILAEIPARRISLLHLAKGDSFILYNGETGWSRSIVEVESGVFARNMRREDLDAVRLEEPLSFAGRLREVFVDLKVDRLEKIDDRETYVIFGRERDTSVLFVELFFDKESGMLVRLVRYTETPFGRVPLQIDYADYRTIGGTKLPFRWIVAIPGRDRRYVYQADEVQLNVPIEGPRFVMPPTAGCQRPRCSPPSAN